jgi:hypothetical protein
VITGVVALKRVLKNAKESNDPQVGGLQAKNTTRKEWPSI